MPAIIIGLLLNKINIETIQMRAAILHQINVPLTVETLKMPSPEDGQVLVKMTASGICHTQLHEIRGNRGEDKYLPHLLGHEGAGVVVATGSNVRKVIPGDHVIVSWIKGAGLEAGGVKYYLGDRVINAGPVAVFSDFALVPENRVTPISKEMPLEEAAIIGCAFATGAGMVFNTALMKSGEKIAIFGVGGIGMSAICAAKIAGASKIIAIDVVPSKLKLAQEFGATDTIDARETDPVAKIYELTDNKGVDYAIEAIGLKKTLEQAYACVRVSGGKAILAGNVTYGETISIDPYDLIRGKQLVGTWGGETQPDRDFPQYVKMYLEEKLPLQKLISHRYGLDEINKAFTDMEAGRVTRAILVFPN